MNIKALKQYLEFIKISGIDSFYYREESNPKPQRQNLIELGESYSNCNLCALAKNRNKFVYGEGDEEAKLMLIGEGPGADENATGNPFVGKAGQLLTKMLAAIKIDRKDVYITNVVKCRPPNNRNPHPEEIDACHPYLEEQISIIQPDLILLLGRVAAEALLQKSLTLRDYRKTTHEVMSVKTYVTYHPSALLRNPGWKKYAWIDLQKLESDYNKLGR